MKLPLSIFCEISLFVNTSILKGLFIFAKRLEDNRFECFVNCNNKKQINTKNKLKRHKKYNLDFFSIFFYNKKYIENKI